MKNIKSKLGFAIAFDVKVIDTEARFWLAPPNGNG
jgi:hypothetical protein